MRDGVPWRHWRGRRQNVAVGGRHPVEVGSATRGDAADPRVLRGLGLLQLLLP